MSSHKSFEKHPPNIAPANASTRLWRRTVLLISYGNSIAWTSHVTSSTRKTPPPLPRAVQSNPHRRSAGCKTRLRQPPNTVRPLRLKCLLGQPCQGEGLQQGMALPSPRLKWQAHDVSRTITARRARRLSVACRLLQCCLNALLCDSRKCLR